MEQKTPPILKARCDACHNAIFQKKDATLVHTLTFCPICLAEMKKYFIGEEIDLHKLKRDIKAEMCDNCSYNPYHNPDQIFYR